MNKVQDISAYIPQRPPFVFIDTIYELDGNVARTSFTVTETCPLLADGVLPLAGLMENAAQTCAARAGNTIGYIGAVKQMEVTRFPHVGEVLATEATVLQEAMNISLIECIIRSGGETIANVTLKIATVG